MKGCQNFIKSYVPGKYLLADALSCPPGMFHLDCHVPAKLGLCNLLGKTRSPLLWEGQNCSEEKQNLLQLFLVAAAEWGVEEERQW